MTDSSLKETTLKIFEELGVIYNPLDIEACHRAGLSSRKRVFIKMFGRKNADRVRRVKKLKGVKL